MLEKVVKRRCSGNGFCSHIAAVLKEKFHHRKRTIQACLARAQIEGVDGSGDVGGCVSPKLWVVVRRFVVRKRVC
jgi:hypothetical protein